MTRRWTPPGQIGEFRLVRRIGAGAIGQVWLAEDTLLQREVAVKFAGALAADRADAARARFLLEARAIARLRHPNVLCVYAAGEVEARPYLVTELLHGEALDAVPRPLDLDAGLRVAVDLARGLAAAHRAGVLHRDVKPANAFRGRDGVVKLVDFGLALLDPDEGARDPAEDGLLVGTPLYLAPERWRGEPATRRTDLYALGAMLYHLWADRPPHPARTVAELAERVGGAAPALGALRPDLPAELTALIDRCVASDPAARPPSADELHAALAALAGRAAAAPEGAVTGEPYPGLAPFDAADTGRFFGRDAEVAATLEALRAGPLVAIVGGSGAGKSSLVHAGVVPRLRAGALGEVRVVEVDPARRGARDEALAAAADARPVIVVVDPLEACLGGDAASWREALDELLARAPAVRLLVALRSDALGRLGALGRARAEVLRRTVVLAPLGREALRAAIVEPARRRGYALDDEAVARLVGEAERGSLPLLQFALARLWEARDEGARRLPAEALRRLGGVAGALAGHADELLDPLPAAVAAEARRVLLALVSPEGARVRREEDELVAGGRRAAEALAVLVAGRLVVAREGERGAAYELAHEALVEGWPRLRGWLAEEAAGRAARSRLSRAAQEWERLGGGRDGLWSGPQLRELAHLGVTPEASRERAFLAASHRSERAARGRRVLLRVGLPLATVATLLVSAAATAAVEAARREQWIDLRLGAARRAADEAAVADAAARAAREAAFAAFDRGDAEAGEVRWGEARAKAAVAARRYADAAAETDRGLARDPGDREARALAADVTARWLALAEREHAGSLTAELAERLASLDAERLRARSAPATLRVTLTPPGGRATLRALPARAGPEQAPGELAAGSWLEVPPGAYAIDAVAPGRAPVRQVVVLAARERAEVGLDLPPAAVVPPGFVHVPAGPALFGSPDEDPVRRALGAEPQRPVTTGAFRIAATETTFGEWLDFLGALPPAEADRRRPRAARIELLLEGDTPRLTLLGASARRGEPLCLPARACRDWLRLPVAGISADDAARYARWLRESGRVPGARLCTSREWERAARGADGRRFPGGDALAPGDANVQDRHGARGVGPEVVGAYRGDVSPFGVRDLAGNVYEWVAGPRGPVLRGGAWDAPTSAARAYGDAPAPDERYVSVGVRVCTDA